MVSLVSNVFTEQFLQGIVPLRQLLNEETEIYPSQDVNDLGPQYEPTLSQLIPLWEIEGEEKSGPQKIFEDFAVMLVGKKKEVKSRTCTRQRKYIVCCV